MATASSDLTTHDLSAEKWREYDFIDSSTGEHRIYRIEEPKTLYVHDGGSTHRVVDRFDAVHCPPAPGQHGCVLRWQPKDPNEPVQF